MGRGHESGAPLGAGEVDLHRPAIAAVTVRMQTGALENLLHEILKGPPGRAGDPRQEAGRGHPRQGVDLQQHLVATLAGDEVDARRALASQGVVRQRTEPQYRAVALRGQSRREVGVDAARGVFI